MRAWLRRRFHRRDWRAEFDEFERKNRIALARAMVPCLRDPATRAELYEKLDQAEGQMQEEAARRNKKAWQ